MIAVVSADLLVGTNVAGVLRASHREARLFKPGDPLPAGLEAVVVDLTCGIAHAVPDGARRVGLYSHVDADTRQEALAAGYDLVVPRSRFAREGGRLVDELLNPNAEP